MKKLLFLCAVLFVGGILISFDIIRSPKENDMQTEWIYHTNVTAWYEATESETLYIYYKEGNGVRKYMYSPYKVSDFHGGYYYVEKNPYYRDSDCKDFRKNYRYCAGIMPVYYFNANLPYMGK